MKKIYALLIFILGISIFTSCNKQDDYSFIEVFDERNNNTFTFDYSEEFECTDVVILEYIIDIRVNEKNPTIYHIGYQNLPDNYIDGFYHYLYFYGIITKRI